METELLLSNGRRLKPVKISTRGRKLALSCSFDRALIDEFKCMKGARFIPEDKTWEVTDCRRNWMQLEALQDDGNGNYRIPVEFKRLHAPRQQFTPTRLNVIQPHQVQMFNAGMNLRCMIWAAEQGTGKTLAAIELMEAAAKLGFTDWWYVAPLKVLRAIELELRKWKCVVKPRLLNYDILDRETQPRFECKFCGNETVEARTWKKSRALKHADVRQDACDLDEQSSCTVCGWYAGQMSDTVARCTMCWREDPRHGNIWREAAPFKCPHGVIFDESSRLKNGGSLRSQAAQDLADRIRAEHDGFVIEMSGTPAPHDPCDLHSQAEIALPGLLRESTRAHLERRCAIIEKQELPDGRMFGNIVGWKEQEVAFLYERLKPIMEVHFAKDCLTLPELVKEVIDLPVSEELKRAARMVAETSINAAQALNKLRQLSDGFQYGGMQPCSACSGENYECENCGGGGFVPGEGLRRAPGAKDDRLREDLAFNEETGRLVIYAGYKASVDRCVELCIEEGWDVLRCDGRGWKWFMQKEGAWTVTDLLAEMDLGTRSDKLEKLAMVSHPGSGGLGLNLTAPRENIFFSNDFNAESRWQAEKRTHRNGQTRGVRIKDYSLLPTDRFILNNLEAKRELQSISLGEVIACL